MWYKYTIKIKLNKKGGIFVEELMENNVKTILIVDDEQPIVEILAHNLEKEGYNTISAGDGLTAVDMALEQKPDLI